MSKNPIQFQAGLSLSEFHQRYGKESQCFRTLVNLKWPLGYACPKCQHKACYFIKQQRRFQCLQCRHQTTVTVGTLLEHTKLPLRTWFYAIYLMTQSKNCISTLSLKRYMGVSYNTAWHIKHKIIMAMQQEEDQIPLEGTIQMDDAYMGGKKKGGKRGRGSDKQPFIAAIATNNNHPMFAKFTVIDSFKQRDVAQWAKQHVVRGSVILSDGLTGFSVLDKHYCHQPIKTTGNKHAQNVIFRWVNTILGNVKRASDGTYHAMRKPYMKRYLMLFQYRFNHRFHLKQMILDAIGLFINTKPIRCKQVLA